MVDCPPALSLPPLIDASAIVSRRMAAISRSRLSFRKGDYLARCRAPMAPMGAAVINATCHSQ